MNYRVLILCLLCSKLSLGQDSLSFIRLNLIGYTNAAPKKALLISKNKIRDNFYIYSFQDQKRIPLKAVLSTRQPWDPFPYNYEIDFSFITKPGEYRIESAKTKINSQSFKIRSYPAIFEDVITFMQTQRCGYNPYIDAVCHPFYGRSFYGNMPDKSYVDARGG